jgi:hypothetical protein
MKQTRVRAYTAILLICILLVLSMTPWIVSSSAPEPLLPDALRREREDYEATRAAAEDAAIEYMRTAPSTITVRTVVAAETPTPTTRRIVIQSETSPVSPTETPTEIPVASPTESSTGTVLPATPLGLVETEDVITEGMLTEQVKRDADDDSLSDLTIGLAPEGISAVAFVTIFPGIKRRIEASGTFAVDNNSLVVTVSTIQFDDLDVTERYRGQLESSLNSSLYRLLPQRYVQSYKLGDGEVRVYSRVRP